jgi:hypothetical protein
MAKCQWCDKELPSNNEEVNSCGSCLFRSREEANKASDEDGATNPEGVKVNFDLSGLGEDKKISKARGKRAGELKTTLFANSMKPEHPQTNQEILMKRVKVKSNSIRGKVLVVGDSLVLNFDENGVAECFASDVPQIKAYCRVRPNRIALVEDAPKKAAPAPAPKKVEKKAEVKVSKSESAKPKTEAKPRVEKKKAPKKFSFKKDAE